MSSAGCASSRRGPPAAPSTTGRLTTSAARAACNRFQSDPKKYLDPAYRPGMHAMQAAPAPLTLRKGTTTVDTLAPSHPRTLAPSHPRTRIHLPDASRGASARSGLVPDLRHGARAGRGKPRGVAERRARRHEPPLLVVARADGSDTRLHGLRDPARAAAASSRAAASDEVGRVRARDAGRAVGRMAVPGAGYCFGHQRSPEHVHAHRDGRRSGVLLQRARDDRAGVVSGRRFG